MATRKTDTKGKGLVLQQLVVKSATRSILDVGQWRTALKSADRGKRDKLYNLYEDILLDNVLGSAIGKRIMAITNADLTFTRNEQNVPEIDDLLDSPEMELILEEIMQARFWGKTVLELDFTNGLKPYVIPRQHVRPDLGIITINVGDETGIPYRADDFFLEAGRDNDLGLLLKVAPMVIYKRGGFGDWAQFVELFGMPQRIGKYSSGDAESRKTLEQALEAAGSASWLVIPKDTDVTNEGISANSNGITYKEFRNACNEEILIGILGQTMTTQNGSSKSQSETHKDVEEGINKADRRFVQRILNRELLPRLEKRGYPVSGGFFYFPDAGENLTTEQQLDIHIKIKNELGLDIDEDWLYETYSVPKPKGGKKPAQNKKEESNQVFSSDANFWERLRSFFYQAPTVIGATNSNICSCGENHHTNFNLANFPTFNNADLINRVAQGEAKDFDTQLFAYTASTLVAGLRKGFASRKFNFAYGFEPDALKTAFEINLFHFSAAKTAAEVQELNALLRSTKSFDEFKAKAEQITDVFNASWLRTEYDTAVLTADSSATYYRLLEQAETFPYWEYVTVNDGNVRAEHRKLHGIILPANDPRWAKIWPPNGWNCRCRIVPRLANEVDASRIAADRAKCDEYFASPEWKKNAAQGFDVNRAITGEVFTKNQQYINKFPRFGSKKIANLYHGDWGLPELSKAMASATETFNPYSGTAADWFAKNATNGVVNITDYQGRNVTLSAKTLSKNTLRNKEKASFLNEIKSVASNPHEVWINDYTSDWKNLIFIKFYKNEAIAVIVELKNGKAYQVNSWFRIATESAQKGKLSPKNRYRRGLLIKK